MNQYESSDQKAILETYKNGYITYLENKDPVRALQFLLRGLQLERRDPELREMTKGLIHHWDAILGEKKDRFRSIKDLLISLSGEVQAASKYTPTKLTDIDRSNASPGGEMESPKEDALRGDPILDSQQSLWHQTQESTESEDIFINYDTYRTEYGEHVSKHLLESYKDDSINVSSVLSNFKINTHQSSLHIKGSGRKQGPSSKKNVPASNRYNAKPRPSSASIFSRKPSGKARKNMASPYAKSSKVTDPIAALDMAMKRKLSTAYTPKVARPEFSRGNKLVRPASALLPRSESRKGNRRPNSVDLYAGHKSLPFNHSIPMIPSQHTITDVILRKRDLHNKKVSGTKIATSPKRKRPESANPRYNEHIRKKKSDSSPKPNTFVDSYLEESFRSDLDRKQRVHQQNKLIEQLRKHLHSGAYLQTSTPRSSQSPGADSLLQSTFEVSDLSEEPISAEDFAKTSESKFNETELWSTSKSITPPKAAKDRIHSKSPKSDHKSLNRSSINKLKSFELIEEILSNPADPLSDLELMLQAEDEAIRQERLTFLRSFSYPGLKNRT